jgi:hypothetical protein
MVLQHRNLGTELPGLEQLLRPLRVAALDVGLEVALLREGVRAERADERALAGVPESQGCQGSML